MAKDIPAVITNELDGIAYNLHAICDHLLDLDEDGVIDAMETIGATSSLYQKILVIQFGESADTVKDDFVKMYGDSLKVNGQIKEAVIMARRMGKSEIVQTLLTAHDILEKYPQNEK